MSESIFNASVYAQNFRPLTARRIDLRSVPNSNVAAPPPARDAALIAIIEAPLEPGETTMVGFARKEAELRTAFAGLSVLESRALHARLANPRSGDLLVAAFMRMTGDRRARLINFLADARRREATRR
jgi:hypothetical protein